MIMCDERVLREWKLNGSLICGGREKRKGALLRWVVIEGMIAILMKVFKILVFRLFAYKFCSTPILSMTPKRPVSHM
jgi:hypothetical protein